MVAVVIAALALLSPLASAQTTSGQSGYDGGTAISTDPGGSGSSSGSGGSRGGGLPFTGFEAGLIAVMGIALLGTGVVLRRNTRRTSY